MRRVFRSVAPDRVWVADLTYVATGEDWLNVAAVVDVSSRRVAGDRG